MHNQGLAATPKRENDPGAILGAHGEWYAMPDFDWESPEIYERTQDAEITGFAWECLRRNPDYQRDHREIVARDLHVTAEFRRRWGLCFRH